MSFPSKKPSIMVRYGYSSSYGNMKPTSLHHLIYILDRNLFKPSCLMRYDVNDIVSMLHEYKSLDLQVQRWLGMMLVKAYHTQSRVKDPIKAADELAGRLFFELLSGRLMVQHLLLGTWVRHAINNMGGGRPRDTLERHQLRVQILRCKVRGSYSGRSQMRMYKWLTFR